MQKWQVFAQWITYNVLDLHTDWFYYMPLDPYKCAKFQPACGVNLQLEQFCWMLEKCEISLACWLRLSPKPILLHRKYYTIQTRDYGAMHAKKILQCSLSNINLIGIHNVSSMNSYGKLLTSPQG